MLLIEPAGGGGARADLDISTPAPLPSHPMQLRMNRIGNPMNARRRIASRILGAGFLFFFIKGLLWLAIGGLAIIGIT